MGQKRNFSSVSHRLLTLRPHLYGHHTVVALVSEVKETGRPQALVYSSLFHHDSFPSVHTRQSCFLLEILLDCQLQVPPSKSRLKTRTPPNCLLLRLSLNDSTPIYGEKACTNSATEAWPIPPPHIHTPGGKGVRAETGQAHQQRRLQARPAGPCQRVQIPSQEHLKATDTFSAGE